MDKETFNHFFVLAAEIAAICVNDPSEELVEVIFDRLAAGYYDDWVERPRALH